MTAKQCPACGTLIPSSKGQTQEYIQFDCPIHGLFEIHERMANHLIKPEYKSHMINLSKWIMHQRRENPTGLLTRAFEYQVKEFQR